LIASFILLCFGRMVYGRLRIKGYLSIMVLPDTIFLCLWTDKICVLPFSVMAMCVP